MYKISSKAEQAALSHLDEISSVICLLLGCYNSVLSHTTRKYILATLKTLTTMLTSAAALDV